MMPATKSVFSFRYGVFDNDGTLVDSIPRCGPLFADVVSAHGVPWAVAKEYYTRTTGRPMREQYRDVLEQHGVVVTDDDIECLRRTFDARFLAIDVRFFPHARRALAALARRQTLFLSSAASDACVWKRIAHGDAAKHFTLAYGSTAIPKGHRHLEVFAEVAGVSLADFAAHAFFCGDSEADMDIARRAGLHAIGVRGTVSDARLHKAGAQRLISSVGELLADPR